MLHFDCVTPALQKVVRELPSLPGLEAFALGGASLALRYGHRLSVELDFFTTETFDSGALLQGLGSMKALQLNRAANTLSLAISEVKVDPLRHDYPLLLPIEEVEDLPLLSIPDVAAMKMNATINRGAKKDFFDLHELLNHYFLEELLRFFERKYPSTNRFIALRSLSYFAEAENEPDPVSPQGVTWSSVKKSLQKSVQTV